MRRFLLLVLLASTVALGQDTFEGSMVYPIETGADVEVVIGNTPPPPPVRPGQLLMFYRWEQNLTDEIGPFTCTWQTGAVSYQPGMDGFAAEIDANESCKLTKTNAQLGDTSDDFSFSWWIFRDYATPIHANIDRVTEPFSAYDWLLWHQGTTTGTAFQVFGAAGSYKAIDANVWADQTWNFTAVTWDDSAEEGWLYVGEDGAALTTTQATVFSAWTGPRRRTAGAFRIMVFPVGDYLADETRYWKVELKPNDIDKLYAAGPP
jgi:hypothetical protein